MQGFEVGSALRRLSLDEYGRFISKQAPWRFFVTLTHDPRRLSEVGHTRVGIQGHRRRLRRFVLGTVRVLDRSAAWWSEMELHESGQPHEHGLLAVSDVAPWLKMRQAWFDANGWAEFDEIVDPEAVASYIGKYGAKSGAYPPFVAGFGLNPRESFSRTLPRMVAQ